MPNEIRAKLRWHCCHGKDYLTDENICILFAQILFSTGSNSLSLFLSIQTTNNQTISLTHEHDNVAVLEISNNEQINPVQ